jgi:hypothetical protein
MFSILGYFRVTLAGNQPILHTIPNEIARLIFFLALSSSTMCLSVVAFVLV